MRRAIYDRARSTLRSQLEGVEPAIPQDQIERERAQLEAVIARLEIEGAGAGRSPRARCRCAMRPRRRTAPPTRLPTSAQDAAPAEKPAPIPPAPEIAKGRARREPEPTDDLRDGRPRGRDNLAPAPNRRRGGFSALDWRKAALAVAALVVVGGVAGLAYTLRDQVDPVRREQAEQAAANPAPTPAAPDAKITSRLGAPSAPAPHPTRRSRSRSAQRATLFIEVPGATDQVPRTVAGRVVWSFENLPSRPGQPLDPAFVATIDLPDAGIVLKLQMTRNRDKSLPASYLIGLIFTTKDSTVKEIAPVLMKTDESERGAPLVGIQQSVGPNLFVMALSADDGDVTKNFDLLSKRGWLEVQFRLADQRRGAIVFEKGIAGDRALLASIDAWK